jgi:hypothetical protein
MQAACWRKLCARRSRIERDRAASSGIERNADALKKSDIRPPFGDRPCANSDNKELFG